MEDRDCNYKFGDGDKCDKPCFGRQDYCIEHYQEMFEQEEEVLPASSTYLSNIPPTVVTVEQVRDVLGIMIPQLIGGAVDPNVMKALTSACLAQAKIIELVDIEGQLKRLEDITNTDIRYVGTLPD